jgi:hypothetical protein
MTLTTVNTVKRQYKNNTKTDQTMFIFRPTIIVDNEQKYMQCFPKLMVDIWKKKTESDLKLTYFTFLVFNSPLPTGHM